ncbi:MAG TPA: amino acid permease [Thermodesulfobacteriota bacterium]|nr:amino acid permease [Thermodesulfobacteriota bacterium]
MRPRPMLTTADAVALMVGLVVGVGIFRAPQLVAEHTGAGWLFVVAWVLGGLVSLVGALCYAELATTYPDAGGEYHFLARAFGPRLGFLFGWSRLTVIQSGSIALLAFVFGDYLAPLLPWGERASPALAAAAVAALTAVNVAGVRYGSRTQNVLTVVEVLGLVLVIAAGFLAGGPQAAARPPDPDPAPAAFGLAMVFVLLTYGGWNETAYVSAELKGERSVGHALLLGIGLITLLYVLVNLAYLAGLGLEGVAASSVVAADLLRVAVGPGAATALSLLVALSAASSVNATIMTGARSAYALGRDCPRLGALARWRAGREAPVNALLVQGAIALALVGFGAVARRGFEAMVAYTAPVFWFFFLLTGVSLVVMRRRDPGRPRPFRVPLYPLVPLLFCASAAFMLYSSLRYAGAGAWLGVAVMLTGVPLLATMRPRPPAAGAP